MLFDVFSGEELIVLHRAINVLFDDVSQLSILVDHPELWVLNLLVVHGARRLLHVHVHQWLHFPLQLYLVLFVL